MGGKIYLLQPDKTLVPMSESRYDTEDLLQGLLEEYPDLLAGEQMNADAPRRWLLVAREMGVPGEEGGAGRWSIDHLFLDQDGIPTLVEVKRSTDTRIRREVVGQILDYAANAVVYWPVEAIAERFREACQARGEDAESSLRQFLHVNEEVDVDEYWQRVKTNLQAQRIRLVFVADIIPAELQRIVEFLNGQMDPAEVLAVEIRQFVGESQKTLVPRVIGKTAMADLKKAHPRQSREWDRDSLLEVVTNHPQLGPPARAAIVRLLDWAEGRGLEVRYGRGAKHPSCYLSLHHRGDRHPFVGIWPLDRRLELQFSGMRGPFADGNARIRLLGRLNEIPGANIDPRRIDGLPPLPISAIVVNGALAQFLSTADWYVDTILAS